MFRVLASNLVQIRQILFKQNSLVFLPYRIQRENSVLIIGILLCLFLSSYAAMTTENQTNTTCGLPSWLQIPSNDTSTFVTNVVLGAINVPFCVWAFLGNLAVVIAVGKTPSLQRPSNILLCGLAIADCLSGLLAQPAFVAWRVMIYRVHQTCDLQLELYWMFRATQYTFAGLSFANLTVMSCDRHYALAKPLKYRAKVTGKGNYLPKLLKFSTVFKYNLNINRKQRLKLQCYLQAKISLILLRFIRQQLLLAVEGFWM